MKLNLFCCGFSTGITIWCLCAQNWDAAVFNFGAILLNYSAYKFHQRLTPTPNNA